MFLIKVAEARGKVAEVALHSAKEELTDMAGASLTFFLFVRQEDAGNYALPFRRNGVNLQQNNLKIESHFKKLFPPQTSMLSSHISGKGTTIRTQGHPALMQFVTSFAFWSFWPLTFTQAEDAARVLLYATSLKYHFTCIPAQRGDRRNGKSLQCTKCVKRAPARVLETHIAYT